MGLFFSIARCLRPGFPGQLTRLKMSAKIGLMSNNNQELFMLQNYTAKYTKINTGYMGQLIEWPEIITEGTDLEECRALLKDALLEMVFAYHQQHQEIPLGNCLIEQLPVEINYVGETA
jgi:predicted RNase H-like HicB family nuclease